ncbi:MAG TPA: addiction module protein [Planctomycetota bacterium]|nr:addiction module protein [Planctomycetota bacterium]
MMPNTRDVLEQALKLPPEARAAIAGSLLESLDQEVDEDAADRWDEEIAKRVRELKSGHVVPIPWSEARRIIAGK